MPVRRPPGASRVRHFGSNPVRHGSTATKVTTSGNILPPLNRAAVLFVAAPASGWACPLRWCWTTSTGTRRTIDERTCGWSVRTATRSFRHIRVGTVGMGAPTADSDTPTVNRTDDGSWIIDPADVSGATPHATTRAATSPSSQCNCPPPGADWICWARRTGFKASSRAAATARRSSAASVVVGRQYRAAYQSDRKPFPFTTGIWLPSNYGTTT